MNYKMNEINKIICGDALEQTGKLPDKSVNCVITSPPYWQLRDYGFDGQWGLEPTFQEYLEHLWSLMDEIWRVLADDGTVWINLGDTYSRGSRSKDGNNHTVINKSKEHHIEPKAKPEYDSDKCLLLIPHRFAIGCIERGWIVRNDIIWAKRNGMPESCTDRFSKKHEYIFMMVKSLNYYFDLDGIKTPYTKPMNRWGGDNFIATGQNTRNDTLGQSYYRHRNMRPDPNGKNPGDVSDFWDIPTKPGSTTHYAGYNSELISKPIIGGCPKGGVILDPFCGIGTTIIRAIELNRIAIGIDGNKEYCDIAQKAIDIELSKMKMFV